MGGASDQRAIVAIARHNFICVNYGDSGDGIGARVALFGRPPARPRTPAGMLICIIGVVYISQSLRTFITKTVFAISVITSRDESDLPLDNYCIELAEGF